MTQTVAHLHVHIYIYKIACDAVSAGSHFQRSFPGTVAKVVTAILRLKTHVLSKPRIQIDPFTNFYWNFKVKSNLLIILFLGGLCLASLLDPGALSRSHLRLRLGLRHRSTLRRCLWRRFRRHDRLDVPAEPREWVSWNLKESGAHEYVTPCIYNIYCIEYIVYYVTPATDQYIVHRHISSGYLVHFCLDGGNVNPKLHTFMIAKTLHR